MTQDVDNSVRSRIPHRIVIHNPRQDTAGFRAAIFRFFVFSATRQR